MSIRVIAIVWDRFPHGGSKLLVMLALADWADDGGSRIYPSVVTLARKIRMSERQTLRILQELHGSSEKPGQFLELLTPKNRGGRRASNQYRIRLETLTKCHSSTKETLTSGAKNTDIAMSGNPDIAMSEEPLEPLNDPLTPRRAGEPEKVYAARLRGTGKTGRKIADRIKGLKAFICSIEKMPFDTTEEMASARTELALLEGEPTQKILPYA